MSPAALALQLILLTGPDHQPIEVNPEAITSIRPPRVSDHFAPGTHCLVFMTDGKLITAVETCEQIKYLLRGGT